VTDESECYELTCKNRRIRKDWLRWWNAPESWF